MKNRRDLLVVIYLGYFVIVMEMLFTQTLLAAAYLVAGLWLVTGSWVAIHVEEEEPWHHPARLAGKIMALSLPVMLVAFLVFPRLEPLWSVPMPSGSGKTGVSGTMAPGQFSSLAKSDRLAFRAEFEGAVPPLTELYWRGVVLTRFDGREWSAQHLEGERDPPRSALDIAPAMTRYRYQVVMEPTGSQWAFPLNGTVANDGDLLYRRDFTLHFAEPLQQRRAIRFTSHPAAITDRYISLLRLQENMVLPEGINPEARELANRLYAEAGSDEKFVARVLNYFREESFFYTLNPPLLGENGVDDFLFRSRRGFCEHYASAFVFLMRAARVPARVVIGYQGGTVNPYERHITVRELDAHAWAEVWQEGKGWVRVDPTYAVAPERIEAGGEQSLQSEEEFLAEAPLSPIRYRSNPLVRLLQNRFDQANYLWHSWVLGYRGERQQQLLLQLLGEVSMRSLGLLALAAFLLVPLVLLALHALRNRPQPLSPAEKIYRRFVRKLARHGLQKRPSEGPLDFLARAGRRWPSAKKELESITHLYLLLVYAPAPERDSGRELLGKLRKEVSRLRIRVANRQNSER
jgi:transglutaminase-like putative cysteine protease